MNNLIKQLQQSVSLLNRKDFSAAKDILIKTAADHPNSPDVWQLLGAAEKNLGNHKNAKKCYEKSLALNSNQPQVLNNYGNLLYALKEFEAAINAYRQALRISPNHPDALFNIANTQLKAGQIQPSIASFLKTLQTHPAHPKVKLGLAEAFIEADETEKAEDILSEELKNNGENLATLFKAGTLFRKLQNWGSAKGCLSQALAIEPGNPAILHHLASIHVSTGEFEKAKSLFEKCIELEPENPIHHYWLNALLWTYNDADFLNSYRELIDSTSSEKILLDYIKLQKLSGNHAAALSQIEAFTNSHPPSVESALIHSELLRLQSRQGAALDLISSTIRSIPESAELAEEKIRILIETGDLKNAATLLEKTAQKGTPSQSKTCLTATTLKLSQQENYTELADYNRFIKSYTIGQPGNYESLPIFLDQVKLALSKFHLTQKAPIEQSLKNGTQTFENLFRYDDPIIKLLKAQIARCVEGYIKSLPDIPGHPLCGQKTGNFKFTDSWSVQLKSGGHHRSHFHPRGWISSVLYIDIPEEIDIDGQGWLEFGVPDLDIKPPVTGDYYIKPAPGLLVLFPSYLWHGTRPFSSSGNRLTVAFDVVPTPRN